MGSGGKVEAPTLDQVGEALVDAAVGVGLAPGGNITAGYSLTESGKKDLKNVKGQVTAITHAGENAKNAANRQTRTAQQQQAERERQMAANEDRKKRGSKYAQMRARQKSLMESIGSGRESTILTGATQPGSALGSAAGGKTLLGQ